MTAMSVRTMDPVPRSGRRRRTVLVTGDSGVVLDETLERTDVDGPEHAPRPLDFFPACLEMVEPVPSSLPALEEQLHSLEEQGVAVLPDLAERLRRGPHHWYAARRQIRALRAVA